MNGKHTAGGLHIASVGVMKMKVIAKLAPGIEYSERLSLQKRNKVALPASEATLLAHRRSERQWTRRFASGTIA